MVALKRQKFVPVILLLVGVICSIYSLIDIVSSWIFVRNAVSTYGTVISEQWVLGWQEKVYNDHEELRMVTIEFRTLDSGQLLHFDIGTSKLQIGQQIEILYDSADPSRVEINEGWLNYFFAILFLIFGVIFFAWGYGWLMSL